MFETETKKGVQLLGVWETETEWRTRSLEEWSPEEWQGQ